MLNGIKFCPKCGADSYIYDSRHKSGMIIRYRRCEACDYRWRTKEIFMAEVASRKGDAK